MFLPRPDWTSWDCRCTIHPANHTSSSCASESYCWRRQICETWFACPWALDVFFCIGSPPRNWSFSWTRNNLHDSFGNLWIQSFKLYLVSNVNPEKSNSSVPAAKSMPANDWLINRGCVDPDITSLRKETFQELKFDSCGQGSNSNFSASATDRVSDKVVDIDGLCSHGLSSAGRNVGNGESTFSVGENGCEQSIPDAGRMNKWVMRGVRLPAILFVLCSATSLVSYCFGFLGSTNCRCLRHFILMRNRQLLCADNSLPLTVWGFLKTFLQTRHHELLSLQLVVQFAPVEILASCRIFDNLQCVTVTLSASGFSRTLFSLSPAWKRTSCSCNIWLLWPHGASRASDPIICATLLLFSSIRPLHRFWIPLNYHIIVNSKFSEGSLTARFTAFLPCHWFSRTAILNWWFWQKKITNVSFHGFKFAACHFFRIFVSDA